MGCSHMGSAPSGLCRAGLESATVPVGKQGEQGWPSPLGEAWRLFLLWWIQSTIKPLSLRPLAPSSWEQNSAGYSGAAESIRGCSRAAPVSLHCSGSPVPISSPGMSPWCPTAELPPGCCCSWGGLNPRHEIPVTGSLHEQVSVVSHEAFYLLNGGLEGAGSPPAGPAPARGSSQGTAAFSVLSFAPSLRLLGSKSLRSAPPSTRESRRASQLVCYSCLDYSLRAGWDDLMDLIRGSWICAPSLLLFGVPSQPSTGSSVRSGAGMVLGWAPGALRSLEGIVSANSCCFAAPCSG